MPRKRIFTYLICGLLLALVPAVRADWPQVDYLASYAQTRAMEPVSCLVCPGDDGTPLSSCYGFGGHSVDATIEVYVIDTDHWPFPNYPAQDIWLVTDTGNLTTCEMYLHPDDHTDVNGMTTFVDPLAAGCQGEGAVILIDGIWISAALDIRFNSPDVSCDGVVNITDVILFTGDFYGTYDYRSDFHWDGVINLSDIAILAQHLLHACP
jgi:hypothetical protein